MPRISGTSNLRVRDFHELADNMSNVKKAVKENTEELKKKRFAL